MSGCEHRRSDLLASLRRTTEEEQPSPSIESMSVAELVTAATRLGVPASRLLAQFGLHRVDERAGTELKRRGDSQ